MEAAVRGVREVKEGPLGLNWIQQVKRWYALYHQRKLLDRLDDRMLRDIGLSRAEAESEAAKPFWKE